MRLLSGSRQVERQGYIHTFSVYFDNAQYILKASKLLQRMLKFIFSFHTERSYVPSDGKVLNHAPQFQARFIRTCTTQPKVIHKWCVFAAFGNKIQIEYPH